MESYKNYFEKLPDLEDKIKHCFEDHYNDFNALKTVCSFGGIDAVKGHFRKGYKIKTLEEYFDHQRATKMPVLTELEKQNPLYIEKAKKLDEYAHMLNASYETLTEDSLTETIKEIRTLVY